MTTTLTIEEAQARLDTVYGANKAPRVTQVSGNAYKIEKWPRIWLCFPREGKPMSGEEPERR